jgi:hypothetical protein
MRAHAPPANDSVLTQPMEVSAFVSRVAFPEIKEGMMSGSASRFAAALVVTCLGSASAIVASTSPASAASLPVMYSQRAAGYEVIAGNLPPVNVTAQFRVPTMACANPTRRSGFGAFVQDSTGLVTGTTGVKVGCVGGQPWFEAFATINGKVTRLKTTVLAGDLVTTTESQTASKTTDTFSDSRTGFTQSVVGPGGSAEYAFIGRLPSSNEYEPMFGMVSFTNVAVTGADGESLSTYIAAEDVQEQIQTTRGRQPPAGKIQVQPSALGPSYFSLVWVHQ